MIHNICESYYVPGKLGRYRVGPVTQRPRVRIPVREGFSTKISKFAKVYLKELRVFDQVEYLTKFLTLKEIEE